MESGNEDIGSSMQRIGSNLLHVVLYDNSSKKEATTMEFPPDLLHVVQSDHSNEKMETQWNLKKPCARRYIATLKTYGISRSFVQDGTRRLAILQT